MPLELEETLPTTDSKDSPDLINYQNMSIDISERSHQHLFASHENPTMRII